MDISVLNSTVYKDAKALGACDAVMGQWTGLYDIDTLIALFNHNQEFCIEKQFPNNEFIKSVTNVVDRTRNGLFVDDKVALHGYSGIVTVLGNSNGFILADGYDALTIYVRHKADLTISCKGFSKVFIMAYDNCHINVEQSELAKVFIYRYGENSTIEHDGEVFLQQKCL